MKRFILAFSMFSIWLAIASTYYMCVIKEQCAGEETVETTTGTPKPVIPKTVVFDTGTGLASSEKNTDSLATTENEVATNDTLKVSGLKIYDKQSLLKGYYGNFKIYKNAPRVKIPLGISEYGYVIAKHMDSVNSALTVKGFYNQEETEELGLQRADFIKERLTKLGIPSKLITTATVSRIFEYTYNKFSGGIEFNFKKTDSVIRLNRVDYSLFKNTQNKATPNNLPEKVITTATTETKITDEDIEAITKKVPTVVPSTEAKKTTTPAAINKEKISFTVTDNDFRNDKFKASKSFRKFIETNKTAKSIQLTGYSNASGNIGDNYNKGLELANLVKSYLVVKGIYTGKTITNAIKTKSLTKDNSIKEGVTLIVQ